ncbi:hypothetical protein [Streptomyces bugieae]|uniref:Uncharacterized protein n=1 Tax=Streptomyces bugieae TaxID=3098223 RepID=A0ABU7NVE4_9ACTN|nr:hypothetical protein [Streptomyces sp. DSM 41528]
MPCRALVPFRMPTFRTRSRTPSRAPSAAPPRVPLRLTPLVLLCVGLLSVLFPCATGVGGHHHAAGPRAVAAAPGPSVPPVAWAPPEAGEGGGHPADACLPGPSGQVPQGRTAAGAPTAAALPGVLGGAVCWTGAQPATAERADGRPGTERGGRATLHALCRCRR